MKTLSRICIVIIVCYFSGCATYNNSTEKNRLMYYYLGSGYDHEIVKVFFDNNEFQFEATSDFSAGIVLSIYFQCSNNAIIMISNDTIIDSVNLYTCKTVNIKVQTNESIIEKNISSSKGSYVIIDKNKAENELRITQSRKPFSLE